MEVKHFPEDMGSIAVNPQAVRSCLVSGLFEEHVEVNGVRRRFFTYLKPGLAYNQRCLILVPDDGEPVLDYLERSFWLDFAKRENIFLHVLVPEEGGWRTDGSDALYMNRVYLQAHSRSRYVTSRDNTYAVGLGAGAVIAQQSAMNIPNEWAGLATFGEMNWQAMRDISRIPQVEQLSRPRKLSDPGRCQLPVWMSWRENSGDNAKVCDYWKAQNNADPERFSNETADEIYFPVRVCKKSQIDEEQIAQVRVTNGFTGEVTQARFDAVWGYIKLAYRHRCFGGGTLRYAIDPQAYGLEKHSMVLDGYTRIWYEYVPESVQKNGSPVPLVLTMHGRNGSAEMFVCVSGMTRVAEERNFIAVFPEAAGYQQNPLGPKNILHWCGCNDGKPNNDVEFIRRLLEDVQSRHCVDPGRVYACGQSSGGMMASELASKMPDTFAAVATWSAIRNHELNTPLPDSGKSVVPYMFLFGDRDRLCCDRQNGELEYHASAFTADFLKRLIARYRLDETPLSFRAGEIQYYVYFNSKRVPLLVVGVIENMPHGNYPRESWISYDTFLAKFSKDAQGNLYYMGQAQRSV